MALDFEHLNLDDLANKFFQPEPITLQPDAISENTVTEVASVNGTTSGRSFEEILGLSSLKNSNRKSFNTIDVMDVDLEIAHDVIDQSPVLLTLIEEGNEIYPSFQHLIEDIFISLYRVNISFLEEYELYHSVQLNRKLMELLLSLPEFSEIRKNCRLSFFNTAMGTQLVGEKAVELLKIILQQLKDYEQKQKELEELLAQERDIDSLAQEQDSLDSLIEEMQQNGASPDEIASLQGQADENSLSLEQAMAIADQLAKNDDLDSLLTGNDADSIATQLRERIVQGSALISNTIKKASYDLNQWGIGDDQTEGMRIPYDNKVKALEQIRHSDKLRKLTNIIGQFKACAQKTQKLKNPNGAQAIKTVTQGNTVTNTLPSERVNLINPTTKKDFYRRYSQKQLLEYKKESFENKNKGPIICCIDTSGSMSGDQEIWSKAFTMAVMEIAHLQKRDFAAIIYSDRADEPIIIEKDEFNTDKIFNISERFHCGGTNFERPLEKAMKVIEDSRFKKADILFITDGECSVSHNFQQRFKQIKEEKEFRCIGVVVGGSGRGGSYGTLTEFCDEIQSVADIRSYNDGNSTENEQLFALL